MSLLCLSSACYGIVQVPTGPWFCRKCESQERAARVVSHMVQLSIHYLYEWTWVTGLLSLNSAIIYKHCKKIGSGEDLYHQCVCSKGRNKEVKIAQCTLKTLEYFIAMGSQHLSSPTGSPVQGLSVFIWFYQRVSGDNVFFFKGEDWFFCPLSLKIRISTIIYGDPLHYYDERCSHKSWSLLLTSPLAENNRGEGTYQVLWKISRKKVVLKDETNAKC